MAKRVTETAANRRKTKVVDLFCGIGGLTHGFIREGFNVAAGIDSDPTCRYGYERNNDAKFIEKDILNVTADELNDLYGKDAGIRILVGCAPCQPFSKLSLTSVTKRHLQPLNKFASLVEKIKPDIVLMENVKGLLKNPVFDDFVETLRRNRYHYTYQVVDFSDYGVPQHRQRLVFLASRLGEISLILPTHKNKKRTVKDVIARLERIRDGETSKKDPLHRSRRLSPLNKRRIRATPKDGGNSRSWDGSLVLECHKKASGKTYRGSVYGRMRWDRPAPTMTTQCVGIGNGRYGHPEQNRAISLREAALFQTFPRDYEFIDPKEEFMVSKVARFIGNAVPVRGGRIIARSIKNHLKNHAKKR
ncbi:MAG: DNA (cytosine-5-)-methyltransferase [Bacteroidota bacterium]